MIGLCTDSSAQLPPGLIERYGIEVVPLTVTIDGVEYLDGVDLDADGFFGRFTPSHSPQVSIGEPSPGQFAAAYEDLVARGCTEILSVHIRASLSGTLNAARLAVRHTTVPVRLVDTGTAGFGVGCCAWAAAEALATGATLEQAAQVAEQLAPRIGSVFVQRASDGTAELVLRTLNDAGPGVIGRAATAVDAVNAMAAHTLAHGDGLRVGVGHSDRESAPLADALQAALDEAANVLQVVRFRIGPSEGTATGPGTFGCFMFPS